MRQSQYIGFLFGALVAAIVALIALHLYRRSRIQREPFVADLIERYTGVIVEPRKHAALEFVLRNVLDNLDERWDIIVFHGTANAEWLTDLIRTKFADVSSRITLKNLGVENVPIPEYNKLFFSQEFTEAIPTEVFLVFQTDSMICPQHKGLIDQFLKYDYAGAPWNDGNVGNGGFSLRRKSKMLEVLRGCPDRSMNEDILFSDSCPAVKVNKSPFEEAKLFSIEGVYSPKSFGIHKAWGHIPTKDIEPQCTGYNTLRSLQYVLS